METTEGTQAKEAPIKTHTLAQAEDLADAAKELLEQNDRGYYTMPAANLYPHQWLWDSCFIAIGIMHYDIERAQQEILSILQGQWTNGMVPHMIFNSEPKYK